MTRRGRDTFYLLLGHLTLLSWWLAEEKSRRNEQYFWWAFISPLVSVCFVSTEINWTSSVGSFPCLVGYFDWSCFKKPSLLNSITLIYFYTKTNTNPNFFSKWHRLLLLSTPARSTSSFVGQYHVMRIYLWCNVRLWWFLPVPSIHHISHNRVVLLNQKVWLLMRERMLPHNCVRNFAL